MISAAPRPSPGLARWAESYEAKCERRQEVRESRRCRPNKTTCRQLGRAPRAEHREQLQRARQTQFCRRRNLEVDKEIRAPHLQARELRSSKGPSRGTEQAPALIESSFGANRITYSRQQVTGTNSEVCSTLHLSTSIQRDLPDCHDSSQMGSLPPRDDPIQELQKYHQGTQTRTEKLWPTSKNDASQQTDCGVTVLDKEIIQLSEYLKEALHRELVLKQKMVILQDLLSTLVRASDSSWKGQLNEDKLKGKLRILESQLYTCTQKCSPWGVKKALLEMEEQKNSYEQKAKESLQKVLGEKMSAEQQLHSTQRSLALAEQKCEAWKSQYEALKEDWKTLETQYRELESQLHVLQSKLQGADSRDSQMRQALRLLQNEHQELQAKIGCLQGDRRQSSLYTQDLQDQLKRSEEERLALVGRVQQFQRLLQNQSVQLQKQEELLKDQALLVWNPKLSHNEAEPGGTGKDKDQELRDQLQKKTSQLQSKEKEWQCGQWILALVLVMATALAMLLANKDNLMV
nr:TRAF3-interacting JNK-activating modulator [Jaculus jaculus]XP_044994273.1 TRAF3-interacting JNK-activating modulator [Jaculus jaculus]XP_044994283.1 TRAF3-interacting JNK-activating modulator [Jaculus jaculus]